MPGQAQPQVPADWRQIDWPRHVHRTSVAGGRLTYADLGEGDGPPLMFVHGLGGQWGNWLANLPVAAQERRAIAVDLPGFGESEIPSDGVSISAYAQVVDELCDRLELGEVVLVGNSMGGFISADLAIERPQRVAGLVLVGAGGIVPSRRERWKALPVLRATGLLTARVGGHNHTVAARPRLRRAALRFVAHDPGRIPGDLVWHGLLGPPAPAFGPALAAALDYLSWDWCERLSRIACPTLVLWGERDAIIPVRHGGEFAQRIPNARSLTLPDTGHIPQVERPDEFNRALSQFVGQVAAARSRSGAAVASPGMGLIEGERSVEIDAPVARCYEIAADIEHAPQWQESLKDVEVLERDGERRAELVETESDAKVKTVRAILRFSYEPTRHIRWVQEKGDTKSLEGSWTLEDLGGQRTRATYALAADPGRMLGLLLRGPAEAKVRDFLLAGAAEGLKAHAESASS